MTIIDRDPAFDEQFQTPKSELSMLAVTAFILSIIVCVPFLLPLGVILGMVALVRLTGNPQLRGRGLAIGAIVLGLCFSIGWGVGLYVTYEKVRDVIAVVNEVPPASIAAGFDGDLDGFLARFDGAHSRDEAGAFIDELRGRYGEFISMTQVGPQPGGGIDQDPDRPITTWRYRAEFDSGMVTIDVELITRSTDPAQIRLGAMRIIDHDHPPLRFPPLPPAPTGDAVRRPGDPTPPVEDGAP